MFTIEIGENEKDQRVDRFLRKYLRRAPLSLLYKTIRKDLKVNGKRVHEDYMLRAGDRVTLYIPDEKLAELRAKPKEHTARRTFRICYEDDDILIAVKPAGLLTHGDRNEKKNHLTNQVISYLIETGAYDPRIEKTFVPAPVNRLDRNTSGLVLFGKNHAALQAFTRMIRERGAIRKTYLALTCGEIPEELCLEGYMTKSGSSNRVRVTPITAGSSGRESQEKTGRDPDGQDARPSEDAGAGKYMKTTVHPIRSAKYRGRAFTLAEVDIETGRTHQIRAQLQEAGYPIVGDPKYGDPRRDRELCRAAGVTTQLLHAYRLTMEKMAEGYERLNGCSFTAQPAGAFRRVEEILFRQKEACGVGKQKPGTDRGNGVQKTR